MKTVDLKSCQIIFNMIPIGLGIAALDGRLLIYNDAMMVPGGYTKDDIEKLDSVADLYYDKADRQRILEKAQKDGHITNERVRFKKKNGDPYYALMSLKMVDFHGEKGWLAAVIDIDDQVEAEQELQKKMEEIEKLNEIMINREVKMAEMKKKLQENNIDL